MALSEEMKNKIFQEAKILLVDDNQINLFVLNKVFEQFGIHADCVPSGKICLKKAEKKEYDIIFMDHMMPDLDGVETLKMLKQQPGFTTPVVVLTANYGENLEKEYKAVGFAEYMIKPAEPKRVREILERYLIRDDDSQVGEAFLKVADSTSLEDKVNSQEKSGLEKQSGIITKEMMEKLKENSYVTKRERMIAFGFTIIDNLIETGMSEEEYEELLQIFKEESVNKLIDCDNFQKNNDLKNYAIIVHGLKNDAGMISDMDLSEHAKEHEIQSKGGNELFVKEQWQDLKEHWENTIDRINAYFEEKRIS